jgi:catechol 2,3-dioxygenase-like lactoylglutathione lyase family enzyme
MAAIMKCTHVALQVRDIERSIAFYRRYCEMRVVHDRTDDFRVVWLGWGEDPPNFVIVLLNKPYEVNRQPEYQHIGIAVESRAAVDAVAERARADGQAVAWPPVDAGPVVGYFCGLADPDGNMVEFSYGQRIG